MAADARSAEGRRRGGAASRTTRCPANRHCRGTWPRRVLHRRRRRECAGPSVLQHRLSDGVSGPGGRGGGGGVMIEVVGEGVCCQKAAAMEVSCVRTRLLRKPWRAGGGARE